MGRHRSQVDAAAKFIPPAMLRYYYRLSPEDYDMLSARQGGVCAICMRRPADALCIDHVTIPAGSAACFADAATAHWVSFATMRFG